MFKGEHKKDYGNRRSSPFQGDSSPTNERSHVFCYECRKSGHIKSECPRLTKKPFNKSSYWKKKALVGGWDDSEETTKDEAEDNDESFFALMVSADSSDSEDEEVNTSNLKNEYDELLTHSYVVSAKFKRLKQQFSQLQKEHALCKQ